MIVFRPPECYIMGRTFFEPHTTGDTAMKQAIVVLAEGSEEIEALGTADILNRCGIMTMLAGISGSIVSGAHDIRVAPDMFLEHTPGSDADAIILPGGLPGATNLMNCEALGAMVREAVAKGKIAAAICAAPIALHAFGVLDGKTVTGYPGSEKLSTRPGLAYTGELVERDGNIITARGAGVALDFGFEIVSALCGAEKADGLRKSMQCR